MNETSLKVGISRDEGTLVEIAKNYQSLLERADWINPYFSPEWLTCWWKRQKKDRRPMFLVANSQCGELLGFWPFVEKPGLLGSKGLWPFVYDEANYHFPTCTNSAASAFCNTLRNLVGSFLFVWIPQVPATFWELHLCERVKEDKPLNIIRNHRYSSFCQPVNNQTFEDYWQEVMGNKSRKSFRYDERALFEKGELTFETCATFEEVRSIMPATCLVEVESVKSRQNSGLYSIRGKRGFFFELLPELARRGRVRVSLLRVDDHPVAWQLEILQSDHSLLHHLAYDEAWKKFSPGKQLLRYCLERCWSEGRRVDFLPAPFAYKEKYANLTQTVFELHWIARSVRGRIARRLILWNMRILQNMRDRSPGLASEVAREEVRRRHGGGG